MDRVVPCGEPQREALVAYLYDECEPRERERVEAHLAACARCAREAAAFRSVRGALEAWTPPEPAPGLRLVAEREPRRARWFPLAWRPGRELAAAAGIVLAAALVFAAGFVLGGVEVQYRDGALVLRTGLVDYVRSLAGTAAAAPAAAAERDAPANAVTPWRADLAALERELRQELTPGAGASQRAARPAFETQALERDALLRQMQGLIAQSERRQQQERALWLTEFAQELDVQRRADQQRLRQELGALEGVADYLVRVSQR